MTSCPNHDDRSVCPDCTTGAAPLDAQTRTFSVLRAAIGACTCSADYSQPVNLNSPHEDTCPLADTEWMQAPRVELTGTITGSSRQPIDEDTRPLGVPPINSRVRRRVDGAVGTVTRLIWHDDTMIIIVRLDDDGYEWSGRLSAWKPIEDTGPCQLSACQLSAGHSGDCCWSPPVGRLHLHKADLEMIIAACRAMGGTDLLSIDRAEAARRIEALAKSLLDRIPAEPQCPGCFGAGTGRRCCICGGAR